MGGSVANVRHQRHETSAFDGRGDSVLADRGATGLAAADDLALAAGELLEKLDVFVIDIHRAWTFAVNHQRIAFLAGDLGLGTSAIDTTFFECRRFGHNSTKILYGYSIYAYCANIFWRQPPLFHAQTVRLVYRGRS